MDCVLTFESTGRDCLENVAHRIQLTDVCNFLCCKVIVIDPNILSSNHFFVIFTC